MNEKVHVVMGTIGGYAREDADRPHLYGVYSDPEVAEKVRRSVSHGAVVVEAEKDTIAPGYLDFGKEVGIFPKDFDGLPIPPVSGRLSSPEIEIQFFDEKSGGLLGLSIMMLKVGKKNERLAHFYIKEGGVLEGGYSMPKNLSAEEILEVSRLVQVHSEKLKKAILEFLPENKARFESDKLLAKSTSSAVPKRVSP